MSVEIARPEQLRAQLELRLPRYLGGVGQNEIRDLHVGPLQQPAGGQSNETVLFDAEWSDGNGVCRRGLVLRLQPGDSRMFLDGDVIREGRLLEDLHHQSSVPVPEVIAIEPDPHILGRPFFLMERIAGHVPGGRPSIHRDPWLVSLDAAQRREVWSNGLGALAAVHETDWRTLRDAWAPRGFVHELDELQQWYRWASGGAHFELLEAGLRAVEHSPPPATKPVLLWGDARPGNIIFADDLSVASVIDWEIATVGPREADIGWWLMMDDFAERGAYGHTLDGMPTREDAVEQYCAVSAATVGDLRYFTLLASVRLAITLLPVASSLTRRGIIATGSRFAHDNVPTQMIARHLDRVEPELSPDYRRLSRMGDPT
jgi:aminoglycoside phosphotransferase (APT) family kinase protein